MKAQKIRTTIAEIVGILLTIVILAPFLLVVVNSAKDSASIVISPISLPKNWGQLLTNMSNVIHNDNFNYWGSFFSSLLITAVSLILLTLFSSMAAWVLVRNKTKWSNFIFMLFVSAMVIPFQVVMLPLLSTFRETSEFLGIQMLQSYKGIIFAYLGFGGSMSVFILHGFVKGIPYELEEAAWIDGCSPEGTFFRIIFPLLKPIQVTVLILNGIWIWNDYLAPISDAWIKWKNQNSSGRSKQFRRFLCKTMGFNPDSSFACHDSDYYLVPVCTETDYSGYGRRCN